MASSNPDSVRVSVFYAQATVTADCATAPKRATAVAAPQVWTVTLELPQGATVRDAVAASGLLVHLPGLAIEALDLGVFNRVCEAERQLEPGDRVEIYRPLQIDPKAARHLRVAARRKAEASARQSPRLATGGADAAEPGKSSQG